MSHFSRICLSPWHVPNKRNRAPAHGSAIGRAAARAHVAADLPPVAYPDACADGAANTCPHADTDGGADDKGAIGQPVLYADRGNVE